jgi:hypothetical protein
LNERNGNAAQRATKPETEITAIYEKEIDLISEWLKLHLKLQGNFLVFGIAEFKRFK